MIKRSGTELEMDQNPLMTDIGKAIRFDFMDQNMDQNDPSNNVKVLVGKTSIEDINSELNEAYGGTVNSYSNFKGISTKISTKQKINDVIQNIAETTGKTPYEIYVMARVQGPSMDPLFKHGANVPVKLMPFDARYKKGDIIAFERDGVFVIHNVEYRFKSDDGKVYYVTGGLNPETNQYVDNMLVSEGDIIGKADLSKKGMVKIAKQGKIVYIEIFGMPNNIDAQKIVSEQKTNDDYNSILSSKTINEEQYSSVLFNLLLTGFSKLNGKILTISDLANELDISEKIINQWLENGIPNNRIESIRKKIWDLKENKLNILTVAQDELIKIECLLDYYNSPFKDYYLSTEKLMEKQLKDPNPPHSKDYPKDWDNPDSPIRAKQREIDLIFTKGLSILSGLTIKATKSGQLHHWETYIPGINKENCQLAATILLDRKEHTPITVKTAQSRGKNYQNDWKIYFEEKSLYCIVSLMNGKIPKCWEIDNSKTTIYNDIRNKDNVKGILFLLLRHSKIAKAYSDSHFLSQLEAKDSTGIESNNVFNDKDFEEWLKTGNHL